jgi:ORF6N domain
MAEIIPFERIEQKIYFIRGKKVMLDRDLAKLYGAKTHVLNQAVKRKKNRFPVEFMFPLTREEIMNLSQIVIGSKIKHAPNVNVFTENGVVNSEHAVQVNIQIMLTFTKLRELMSMNKDLFQRLNRYYAHLAKHDKEISNVFEAIQCIVDLPVTLRRKPKPMGFKPRKS